MGWLVRQHTLSQTHGGTHTHTHTHTHTRTHARTHARTHTHTHTHTHTQHTHTHTHTPISSQSCPTVIPDKPASPSLAQVRNENTCGQGHQLSHAASNQAGRVTLTSSRYRHYSSETDFLLFRHLSHAMFWMLARWQFEKIYITQNGEIRTPPPHTHTFLLLLLLLLLLINKTCNELLAYPHTHVAHTLDTSHSASCNTLRHLFLICLLTKLTQFHLFISVKTKTKKR